MKTSNWYVVTGGPSSGKTTIVKALANLGYKVFEEAARVLIDDEIAKGRTLEEIRNDEKKFQEAVLEYKIKIESKHDPKVLSFFDRGMHDTIAYYQAYGWDIASKIYAASKNSFYKKVFVLEPLPFFEKDYARTEDKDFSEKLTKNLYEAYESYGIPVIKVPQMSPNERVQFILEHIE